LVGASIVQVCTGGVKNQLSSRPAVIAASTAGQKPPTSVTTMTARRYSNNSSTRARWDRAIVSATVSAGSTVAAIARPANNRRRLRPGGRVAARRLNAGTGVVAVSPAGVLRPGVTASSVALPSTGRGAYREATPRTRRTRAPAPAAPVATTASATAAGAVPCRCNSPYGAREKPATVNQPIAARGAAASGCAIDAVAATSRLVATSTPGPPSRPFASTATTPIRSMPRNPIGSTKAASTGWL